MSPAHEGDEPARPSSTSPLAALRAGLTEAPPAVRDTVSWALAAVVLVRGGGELAGLVGAPGYVTAPLAMIALAGWMVAAARACSSVGAHPVDAGWRRALVAQLVPLWNLWAPFMIVRELSTASSVDDLAPAHERVTIHNPGYRVAAARVRLVAPSAPKAPLVVLWQVVVLSRLLVIPHMAARGALWLVRAGSLLEWALEAYVVAVVTLRILARAAHTSRLERAEGPPA